MTLILIQGKRAIVKDRFQVKLYPFFLFTIWPYNEKRANPYYRTAPVCLIKLHLYLSSESSKIICLSKHFIILEFLGCHFFLLHSIANFLNKVNVNNYRLNRHS